MSLLEIRNDSDIRRLSRSGYRSYNNPDGRIEQLGNLSDRNSAEEVRRKLQSVEREKRFYVLKTKDEAYPYDIVYKEDKEKKKKSKKEKLKELAKLRRNKMERRILKF